jgi:hypothetical protein
MPGMRTIKWKVDRSPAPRGGCGVAANDILQVRATGVFNYTKGTWWLQDTIDLSTNSNQVHHPDPATTPVPQYILEDNNTATPAKLECRDNGQTPGTVWTASAEDTGGGIYDPDDHDREKRPQPPAP